MDLIIRQARLQDGAKLKDIAIQDGKIIEIAEHIEGDAGRIIEAEGRVLIPGLIESHIHLDKALIASRKPNKSGTLQEAIKVTAELKPTFTKEDVYNRAKQALEMIITSGVTTIRTHSEFDPAQGFTGFETILQLKEEYSDLVDIQVVAFPQEGIFKAPGTEEMMYQAMEMGKLANKVNLPILSIPYDYNFTQIISVINQNDKFSQSMLSSLEVSMHNKMYRILEAGNGSRHVIQALAESIQNPVLILDQNFMVTHYSDLPGNPIKLSDILNEPNKQYIQSLLSEKLDAQLRFYHDPVNLDFIFNSHTVPIRIFPIKKNTIIISYLVIWNTMHDIGPLDIVQLKVVAKYLLLQLQLEYSLNIESYQKRNEMFFEIIRNKYHNEDDLTQFIRYYQLKPDDIYSIIILSISSHQPLSNRQMMNLSTRLNQMLSGYRQKMICIEYNNSFLLLVQDPPADEKDYLKAMNTIGKSLLNQLVTESTVEDITMVIGPIVPNINQIYVSFQQALQTLDIYTKDVSMDKTNRIISYDDVFLKHIIRDYLSLEGLHKITERFITPFNQLDNSNRTDYLRTLQAYYQNHRNITKAAEALFIHRNTLLHRLSKIEDLLSISFDVPGDNLQLEFVIYILPFL